MLLDCRDLSKTFVPLDPRELRVVVANSMIKHELSGGEYAQRRSQCEQAVQFFRTGNNAITSLRDVKMRLVERRGQSWAMWCFAACGTWFRRSRERRNSPACSHKNITTKPAR